MQAGQTVAPAAGQGGEPGAALTSWSRASVRSSSGGQGCRVGQCLLPQHGLPVAAGRRAHYASPLELGNQRASVSRSNCTPLELRN